jgi:hypothetical protein
MSACDRCFIKDDGLVTRSIAGETIIVPVRGGVGDLDSIYILNEMAAIIWQLIDGRAPVTELIQVICTEYDVSEEVATKDINDFLSSLEAVGLIWPTDDTGG